MKAYAIKAAIGDLQAESHVFARQKTMYGGKNIAPGDTVYLFWSENAGGLGLFAKGNVESVEAVARLPDLERQTPRVSLLVKRDAIATSPLGRAELKSFRDLHDGRWRPN